MYALDSRSAAPACQQKASESALKGDVQAALDTVTVDQCIYVTNSCRLVTVKLINASDGLCTCVGRQANDIIPTYAHSRGSMALSQT